MFDEREERGEKSQNQSKRHALFPIEKNNRVRDGLNHGERDHRRGTGRFRSRTPITLCKNNNFYTEIGIHKKNLQKANPWKSN